MDYFAEAKRLPFAALLAQSKEIENGLRCGRCGAPLPRKNGPCPQPEAWPHRPHPSR